MLACMAGWFSRIIRFGSFPDCVTADLLLGRVQLYLSLGLSCRFLTLTSPFQPQLYHPRLVFQIVFLLLCSVFLQSRPRIEAGKGRRTLLVCPRILQVWLSVRPSWLCLVTSLIFFGLDKTGAKGSPYFHRPTWFFKWEEMGKVLCSISWSWIDFIPIKSVLELVISIW